MYFNPQPGFQMMNLMIAYIDPGSGAMLLQILIVGILGLGLFFRRAISRIAFWRKPPDTRSDVHDPDKEDTRDEPNGNKD